MARKKKVEEHENLERWLVSYADFITLLFAFFVVMYSISSINEEKYRVLSDALVAAFTNVPRTLQPVQISEVTRAPSNTDSSVINNPNTMGLPNFPALKTRYDPAVKILEGDASRIQQAMERMTTEIERAMEPLIRKGLISVRRTTSWIEVEIKTSILFPSGSARLSAGAIPVLEKLAEILRPFPNAIHVEGFTDNVPINTLAFPSNWELSAARAASVVHLFERAAVDPKRMAAIAFGEYRPIADNSTEEGRSKNRRVVLVILAQPQDQHLLELGQIDFDSAATEPRQASPEPSADTMPDGLPIPVTPEPDENAPTDEAQETAAVQPEREAPREVTDNSQPVLRAVELPVTRLPPIALPNGPLPLVLPEDRGHAR